MTLIKNPPVFTIPGRSVYAIPERKDDLRFRQYAIHINNIDYMMQELYPDELFASGMAQGMPTAFCHLNNELHLWPTPDKEYEVVII